MSPQEYLQVWYGKKKVGSLWRNSYGILGFRYEEAWRDHGFPISLQMPLDKEEYSPESGKAHPFFANLLPEANARLHVLRDLKIANTDFDLLKAIGGECAGALSILPFDYLPTEKWQYRKLNQEDLKKILLRKGMVYNFIMGKNRPRLSLAGAQDKCPIFFDGEYSLPEDAAPSTHILKFEIAEYRHIPLYEYFVTKLAKEVGLPAVDIQLKREGKEYYLLIKRYDRLMDNNKQVKRLHQEDFCQALGLGSDKKYQQEGGPSFPDCLQLIQQVSADPLKDAKNLLKWQMFNVVVGNSDGHAKNLALLYNEDHQPRLAPFYDLVCTRAIERIDVKLAMSVGLEFNPNKITLENWNKMAQDCKVNRSYFINMLKDMCEILLDKWKIAEEEFESCFGPVPALQRVRLVVFKQCKKTLKQISD